MKKRGFTLVELLAVIVILAIIAVIATPIILNVIENSEKGAFKASALSVLDAADYYAVEKELDLESAPLENPINIQSLNFKNKAQFEGEISSTDGEFVLDYLTDGKYCAKGTKTELKITKENCTKGDVDNKPVNICSVTISGNTTSAKNYSKNDITLTASVTCSQDVENISYRWVKDGKEISDATSNSYTATESGTYAVSISADGKTATSTTKVYIGKGSPTVTATAKNKNGKILVEGVCNVQNDSGVGKYYFSKDGINWEESTINSKYYGTSENLKEGTSYTFYFKCSDGAGNVSPDITTSIEYEIVGLPIFSVSPTGWASSKVVTIDYSKTYSYDEARQPLYLFYVESGTVSLQSSNFAFGPCYVYDSDNIPNSEIGYRCSSTTDSISTIENNTWYAVNSIGTQTSDDVNDAISLVVSSDAIIKAIDVDYAYYLENKEGTGLGNPISYEVNNIDTEKPTITGEVIGTSIKATVNDNVSGIKEWCVSTTKTCSSSNVLDEVKNQMEITYTATKTGTYYIIVKDQAGNTTRKAFDITVYDSYDFTEKVTYNNESWIVMETSNSSTPTVRIMKATYVGSNQISFCNNEYCEDSGNDLGYEYYADSNLKKLGVEAHELPTEDEAYNYCREVSSYKTSISQGSDCQIWIYNSSYENTEKAGLAAQYYDGSIDEVVMVASLMEQAYLVPIKTVSKANVSK